MVAEHLLDDEARERQLQSDCVGVLGASLVVARVERLLDQLLGPVDCGERAAQNRAAHRAPGAELAFAEDLHARAALRDDVTDGDSVLADQEAHRQVRDHDLAGMFAAILLSALVRRLVLAAVATVATRRRRTFHKAIDGFGRQGDARLGPGQEDEAGTVSVRALRDADLGARVRGNRLRSTRLEGLRDAHAHNLRRHARVVRLSCGVQDPQQSSRR
mmetsp:Transcript_3795/g.14083  ORF Transcript_3795/g.14083 Transcript_3795/m.14083 type:complete len:217 (+) Transcript_3795:1248-1898(+)